MIIYKATCIINNKNYIGQTTKTLSERKKEHENSINAKNCKNRPFPRAIKKYGKENFLWEVICECNSLDELDEKEKYYIKFYNSLVDNGLGYNCDLGGNRGKHCETTKQKMSESQKGIKNHMYGKNEKLNPASKKVKNITTGNIYDSVTQCARLENRKSSTFINECCRGRKNSAYGCVYRYLDENNNIIPPTIVKTKKIIEEDIIIDIVSKKEYKNSKEILDEYNLKYNSNLTNLIKKGNGICFYKNRVFKKKNADIEPDIIQQYLNKIK